MSTFRPWLRWGPGVFPTTLALLSLLKVVEAQDGSRRQLLLLTPWDQGVVEFTHSVMGRPVRIEFSLGRFFHGFRAYTDPETEAYYTEGSYTWNSRLRKEARKELVYCSEVGLFLKLGTHWLRTRGNCPKVRILWPL